MPHTSIQNGETHVAVPLAARTSPASYAAFYALQHLPRGANASSSTTGRNCVRPSSAPPLRTAPPKLPSSLVVHPSAMFPNMRSGGGIVQNNRTSNLPSTAGPFQTLLDVRRSRAYADFVSLLSHVPPRHVGTVLEGAFSDASVIRSGAHSAAHSAVMGYGNDAMGGAQTTSNAGSEGTAGIETDIDDGAE